jgi:hypothetical protein
MPAIKKLSSRFTEAELDDEIVIMHVDTGEFFGLSDTAAAAWRLMDGQRDRAALLSALAAKFESDEGQIALDVDEFLENLREAGLVVDD